MVAAPIVPGLLPETRELRRVLCAGQAAGARTFAVRPVQVGNAERAELLRRVERLRPDRLPAVRRALAWRRATAEARERLAAAAVALRGQYRLGGAPFPLLGAQQLDLFELDGERRRPGASSPTAAVA